MNIEDLKPYFHKKIILRNYQNTDEWAGTFETINHGQTSLESIVEFVSFDSAEYHAVKRTLSNTRITELPITIHLLDPTHMHFAFEKDDIYILAASKQSFEINENKLQTKKTLTKNDVDYNKYWSLLAAAGLIPRSL